MSLVENAYILDSINPSTPRDGFDIRTDPAELMEQLKGRNGVFGNIGQWISCFPEIQLANEEDNSFHVMFANTNAGYPAEAIDAETSAGFFTKVLDAIRGDKTIVAGFNVGSDDPVWKKPSQSWGYWHIHVVKTDGNKSPFPADKRLPDRLAEPGRNHALRTISAALLRQSAMDAGLTAEAGDLSDDSFPAGGNSMFISETTDGASFFRLLQRLDARYRMLHTELSQALLDPEHDLNPSNLASVSLRPHNPGFHVSNGKEFNDEENMAVTTIYRYLYTRIDSTRNSIPVAQDKRIYLAPSHSVAFRQRNGKLECILKPNMYRKAEWFDALGIVVKRAFPEETGGEPPSQENRLRKAVTAYRKLFEQA